MCLQRASLRENDSGISAGYNGGMCRNIKPLFNFEPPATEDEIRASALQFVRKISGFTRPSKTNAAIFDRAVDDVTAVARNLIDALETEAPARNREAVAARARARAVRRYPQSA
jgi:hypothetical protein